MSDKNNTQPEAQEFTHEQYIEALKLTNSLTEKAIRRAIKKVGLIAKSSVLDVPCGIGMHSLWMAEQTPQLTVIGGDISEEHLSCAGELIEGKNIQAAVSFEKRDLFHLSDADNSYDLVWCCDGLWVGNIEQGAIDSTPYSILQEFKRVLRPGGKVALLFWTDQKLLPGYPYLEGALKATQSANRPLTPLNAPEFHNYKAGAWLGRAGFTNISCQNFPADISGPLSEAQKAAVTMSLNMLYGDAVSEISADMRDLYREIIDTASPDYILADENYAGYVMYSMFSGQLS